MGFKETIKTGASATPSRRLVINAPIVEAKTQDSYRNAPAEEVKKIVEESSANLTGLLRDPEAVSKVESVNPLAVADYEESARDKALKIMNALRTLGPAVGRAFAYSDKEEEQVEYLIKMTSATHEMAKQMAEQMGVNHSTAGNRWMINVLERTFMEALPDSMIEDGKIGSQMIQAIYDVAAEREQEKGTFNIKDVPMKLSVQLAIVKAMSPVLKEQENFSFYRNKDTDVSEFANIIMSSAAKAVEETLDPLAREEDRVVAYKVFLEEAGICLAYCWKEEAAKVKEALSLKSKPEVKALLDARPDGLSIDKVISNFEEQFRRLKGLALLPKSPK